MLDLADGELQEATPHLAERGRVTRREEPIGAFALGVVLDALARERLRRLTRGLLGGEDERDVTSEHSLEDRANQRVVRAAEDHGVDAYFFQRGDVLAHRRLRLLAVGLVTLDERHEPRAGHRIERHTAVERAHELRVPAGVDTVILGCTHYPLIRPIFQRVFGRGVTLVFSAEETAREVAETLGRKGIENPGSGEGSYRFLTTGDAEVFRVTGARFLQLPIAEVQRVALAELEAAAA